MTPSQPVRKHHPLERRALGRTVRETRARRAWSLMTLADHAGTHYNYIGALERGLVNPTFESLLALCTALDVTLGELFALYDVRLVEIAAREA